ncbi:Protein MOR1 (Protein GEM1) (Protein GEMINI POLLEN 1) (Protein MICROTUBULE ORGANIZATION 1) (Protein RID5) (Protein ROOT INITIATION DEFECTIVE 5) [Durusdinium trenchii]|uniref:Protein MOR1 (Protein GEM1) (Protein GEMINI POLLEN 1) (Protein MICROTUBULE ORGANIZATION 1) (Protein RID5) (Protein ROOT INITIATION DEFECTIVE 5) n=1 Tax=Durusdinium trenchii TaxID=1381693 RepID=A0ABP0SI32_9DINO
MTTCTRSASCKCSDCMAAMEMFSAKDLVAVASSKVSFGDDEDASGGNAETKQQEDRASSSDSTPPSAENGKQEQQQEDQQSENAPSTVPNGDAQPCDTQATSPHVLEGRPPPQPTEAAKPQAVQVVDAPEENFEGLGIPELLGHANWKARKVGFEKLTGDAEAVQETDFFTCIQETSMGALDAGLECAQAFVQKKYSGSDQGALISKAVPKLFKKALVGRPGTKARAINLCLDFMEVDATTMQATLDALKSGIKETNPKIGVGCLACFRKAVTEFGGRKVPIQAVQDAIISAMEQKSPLLRKEATALATDMDAWLGGAFKDIVTAVIETDATRKTLIKALEDAAKKSKGEEVKAPTRKFRGESSPSGTPDASAAGQNAEPVDLFDVLPEKSILDKLSSIKFDKRIKEIKWAERKKVLSEVEEMCGTPPKLVKGDYTDLVRTLRGLLQNDSNQAVVVSTIQLLGVLGQGLRHEFHSHARVSCSLLLFRYRDKKTPLLSATDSTLDTFARHCFNVTEERVVANIAENLSTTASAGKQKSTPLQRAHILSWLSRVLESGWCWHDDNKAGFDLAGLEQIFEFLVSGASDADAKVRDISATCLGQLHHASEEQDRLPEAVVTILKAAIDKVSKANSKLVSKIMRAAAGPETKAAPPATAAPPTQQPAKASAEAQSPPRAAAKKGAAKKPALSKARPAADKPVVAKGGPKATAAVAPGLDVGDGEVAGSVMTCEEASEQVTSLGVENLEQALETFAAATKWQDKLHVFDALEAFVTKSENGISQQEAHALIVFVGSKTKQFKEANFNIMLGAWGLAGKIVAACDNPPVGKSYAAYLMTPAAKKIGDKKQGEPVKSMVLALCEACGPKFLASRILGEMETVSSPKVLEDTFKLLVAIAQDFGAQSLNVKAIVDFCVSAKGVDARQLPCKNAAIGCLAELYRQLGEPVRQLAGSAGGSGLQQAFDKAGFEGPGKVEPKRKVKGVIAAADDGGPAAFSLGDLIPRADVSSLLTDQLMEQLGDESSKSAWKIRNKAISDILDIVAGANNRVQLNRAVKMTVAELRKRLHDSNRNIVAKSVTAIGVLGHATGGDGVASIAKGTGEPLMQCLSDSKKTVVMATQEALEVWTVHDGEPDPAAFLAVLEQCPVPLLDAKNDRKVILQWMLKHFVSCEKGWDKELAGEAHETVRALVGPLLSCLQSRDPTSRKLAISSIATVVRFLGREEGEELFQTGCRDFKPAVARELAGRLKAAFAEAWEGEGVSPAAPTEARPAPTKASSPGARSEGGLPSPERKAKPAGRRGASTASFRGPRKYGTMPRGTSKGFGTLGGRSDASFKSHAGASFKSHAGVPMSEADEEEDLEPAFKPIVAGLRARREERARRKKWPAMFDEKDKHRMAELKQMLQEDLEKCVSRGLLAKMFRKADAGRAARGAALDPAFSTLSDAFESFPHEICDCFDLLLKWSTLQLHNNNSTVTVNVLAFLSQLFETAKASEYSMSDYEAASFLPHLLAKLSEKQKRFRESVREVMNLVCSCYPYQKYVPYVNSEISPNQRSTSVVAECIDELARLVASVGLDLLRTKVGVGQNVMKSVARMVNDSRKEVRAAALCFMEEVWEREDRNIDAVFSRIQKYCKDEPLTDKSATLIENHLNAAAQRAPAFDTDDQGAPPGQQTHGVLPKRKLGLQHHNVNVGLGNSPPGSPNLDGNDRVGNLRRTAATESPKTPESVRGKSLKGHVLLEEAELPETPPSPSERKRLSLTGGFGLAGTPSGLEKENDPNSEVLSQAIFHATLGPGAAGSLLGTPAKSDSYVGFKSSITSIEKDAKEYLALLCKPEQEQQEGGLNQRTRKLGIRALALLGSKEPQQGFHGTPEEWAKLLASNMNAANVLEVVLSLLDIVIESDMDLSGRDMAAAQRENRLLKLVLPAIFTLAWWSDLRNAASKEPRLGTRWVRTMCELISRLLQYQQLGSNGLQGSEEMHEIGVERQKLLKTSQTVFVKLTETPFWLSEVLSCLRVANEHLKHVFVVSLAEFTVLQDSMLDPFGKTDLSPLFCKSLEDVIKAEEAVGTEGEAYQCLTKLVSALARLKGKEFHAQIPKSCTRIRLMLARIITETTTKVGGPAPSVAAALPPAAPPAAAPAPAVPAEQPAASAGEATPVRLTSDEAQALGQILDGIKGAVHDKDSALAKRYRQDLVQFAEKHGRDKVFEALEDTSPVFKKFILGNIFENGTSQSDEPKPRPTRQRVADFRRRFSKRTSAPAADAETEASSPEPERMESKATDQAPAAQIDAKPSGSLTPPSPQPEAAAVGDAAPLQEGNTMASQASKTLFDIRARMAARKKKKEQASTTTEE